MLFNIKKQKMYKHEQNKWWVLQQCNNCCLLSQLPPEETCKTHIGPYGQSIEFPIANTPLNFPLMQRKHESERNRIVYV